MEEAVHSSVLSLLVCPLGSSSNLGERRLEFLVVVVIGTMGAGVAPVVAASRVTAAGRASDAGSDQGPAIKNEKLSTLPSSTYMRRARSTMVYITDFA